MDALTVILPTYNESENLTFLIPEILLNDWGFNSQNIKVLVVDDNSQDGTHELMIKFVQQDSRVQYIPRNAGPSLPQSIWEGIEASSTEYVAWLDADGSMPIQDLARLVRIAQTEDLDVVIGSRFVVGGGFKGLNEVGRTSIHDFYRNLRESQDSIVAVVLSRALNEFLRLMLRAGVRDLTSGFFVARKTFLKASDFDASYGDYCPVLIKRLVVRGAALSEVGYLCLPRRFGDSKTGSSLLSYLKRGIPYITKSINEVVRPIP